MKKTMISLSMMMLLHPTYADPAQPGTSTNAEGTVTVGGTQKPNTQEAATQTTAPMSQPTGMQPNIAPSSAQPASTQSTTAAIPASTTTTAEVTTNTLDCHYAIPSQTTEVDQGLVMRWTQKAIEQSFTFEYSQLDSQLDNLKACFTENGWQSFHDALNKSGNLKAITTQQLQVSAMVDGESAVQKNKANQWKLMIPLQVVYQNKQQKINQALSVEVLVGRKPSGDLGIMQVIAQPKKAQEPAAKTTAPTAEPSAQPSGEPTSGQ